MDKALEINVNGRRQLVGRKDLRHSLATVLSDGRLRVVLLSGPPGSGKHVTALAAARYLLCSEAYAKNTDLTVCENCSDCRYTASSTHPDLLDFYPTDQEKLIKTERVRAEICAEMPLSSRRGGRRIFIIPADYLNETSQNVLLKSLENIPDLTYVILTASHSEAVLVTLRSRCTLFRMPRLTETEMRELLSIYAIEIPELTEFRRIIGFADGNPGRVLDACSNDDFLPMQRETMHMLDDLGHLDYGHLIIKYGDWLATHDFHLFADLLRYEVAEIIKNRFQVNIPDNEKVQDGFSLHGDSVGRLNCSIDSLKKILNYIEDTKSAIAGNVNTEIAFTRLILVLRKELINA